MEKNQRTLTIPFISGKDLKRVKLSNKMEVYAYVFISCSGKQKTALNRDDKESAVVQILVFELNCCEQNGGDKVIGQVFMRVKDLMGSIESNLTYHGKLYFMYEWEYEKVAKALLSPPPLTMAAVTSFIARYPPSLVMGPPPYGAIAAAAG
ncbi:hypothetical protein ACSBR2_010887 [Camellia fascicularis]